MLGICDSIHPEIVYLGSECPLCKALYAHGKEVSRRKVLEAELERFRDEFDDLQKLVKGRRGFCKNGKQMLDTQSRLCYSYKK